MIRRMLSLRAIDGPAPELLAVFGTRTATYDPAPFYLGRQLVVRALRREFGEVGYSCLSEFTTGKSAYSGGLRRPHWNMLIRGPGVELVDPVRGLAVPIWCKHVDAEPEAQYVEPLRDTAALMRYLVEHFQKTDQQPPRGAAWKHKQRFNCSRNYFAPMTRAEARANAWESLQLEREVVKAQRAGAVDPVGEAELALEDLRSLSWSLERKGAIEPASRPMRLVRAAVLKGKHWEYVDAGRSIPPGECKEARVGRCPEGFKACASEPKGQMGDRGGERKVEPETSTGTAQDRRFVLDFRREVRGERDSGAHDLSDVQTGPASPS